MKKYIFTLLIILLTFTAVHSQNTDSLIHVLKTKPMSFEETSKLYSQICHTFLYSDLDKSFEYANEALELAIKEKSIRYQSLFNEYLGKVYIYRSNTDSAKYRLNRALEFAREGKEYETEASIHLCYGLLYTQLSEYEKALEHYTTSLKFYEDLNHTFNVSIILANISSIHRTLNNYDRALFYLQKAEVENNKMKESESATSRMNTYYNIAGVYGEMNEMDSAFTYTSKTLSLARKYKNIPYEVVSLHALSVFSSEMNDFEKAVEYGEEALIKSESYGNTKLILGIWTGLSDAYYNMGNWSKSEGAALQALDVDSTDFHHNKTLFFNIIQSNIHLGKKEKASLYLKKYNEFWKESSEKNYNESLTNMEVKYETEKKDIQIAALEKEKKFYYWLGIAGLLFAVALGVALWQYIRQTKKEKQLIASRSVMDGEMQERIRLARDLHDRLSGNLSAVKMEVSNGSGNLQEISHKLDGCIDEVRRVAHNLMPASLQYGLRVALEDFVAQLSEVHFHFFGNEKRIDDRTEYVTYCCAVELVNNSLRHSGADKINLQLIQHDEELTLTVQDNGGGYDEKTASPGLGLKSIHDRIKSCNGKIDINSSPNYGTETTIHLKARKEKTR